MLFMRYVFMLCLSNAGVWAINFVESQALRLAFPNPSLTNWKLEGSARMDHLGVILTSGSIASAQMEQGSIWNFVPITASSWEVDVQFMVQGNPSHPGEGMIITFTESPIQSGGLFGVNPDIRGLAIVLDSKDNDGLGNNPAISAHWFDGVKQYTFEDDGVGQQIAGCLADFRGRSHPVLIRIEYVGEDQKLAVSLDLRGSGVFQRCFAVEDFHLQSSKVFFGIGAMSLKQDMHQVLDIVVREQSGFVHSEVSAQPEAVSEEPELEQVDKIAHEKLDQLIKSTKTVLDVHQLGQALDEIEVNLVRHLNLKFAPLSQALRFVTDKQTQFSDHLSTLRSVDLPRYQTAIQEVHRKLSALPNANTANGQLIDEVMKKLETNIDEMVREQIRRLENRLVQAMPQQSGLGYGFWILIVLCQVLFAVVVSQAMLSRSRAKDYKLL